MKPPPRTALDDALLSPMPGARSQGPFTPRGRRGVTHVPTSRKQYPGPNNFFFEFTPPPRASHQVSCSHTSPLMFTTHTPCQPRRPHCSARDHHTCTSAHVHTYTCTRTRAHVHTSHVHVHTSHVHVHTCTRHTYTCTRRTRAHTYLAGTLLELKVAEGDVVHLGQQLCIVEAMKSMCMCMSAWAWPCVHRRGHEEY